MYKRYISMSGDGSGYGHFGYGDTLEESQHQLKKAGGNLKRHSVWEFKSDFPFAPTDREANDDESDCWVGRDGSMNWIRCEREEVLEVG